MSTHGHRDGRPRTKSHKKSDIGGDATTGGLAGQAESRTCHPQSSLISAPAIQASDREWHRARPGS